MQRLLKLLNKIKHNTILLTGAFLLLALTGFGLWSAISHMKFGSIFNPPAKIQEPANTTQEAKQKPSYQPNRQDKHETAIDPNLLVLLESKKNLLNGFHQILLKLDDGETIEPYESALTEAFMAYPIADSEFSQEEIEDYLYYLDRLASSGSITSAKEMGIALLKGDHLSADALKVAREQLALSAENDAISAYYLGSSYVNSPLGENANSPYQAYKWLSKAKADLTSTHPFFHDLHYHLAMAAKELAQEPSSIEKLSSMFHHISKVELIEDAIASFEKALMVDGENNTEARLSLVELQLVSDDLSPASESRHRRNGLEQIKTIIVDELILPQLERLYLVLAHMQFPTELEELHAQVLNAMCGVTQITADSLYKAASAVSSQKIQFALLKQASERNHEYATIELAVAHKYGIGTEKNYRQSYDTLSKLALDPSSDPTVKGIAFYKMAEFYRDGTGTEKDLKAAGEYFQKAAIAFPDPDRNHSDYPNDYDAIYEVAKILYLDFSSRRPSYYMGRDLDSSNRKFRIIIQRLQNVGYQIDPKYLK